MNKRVSSLVLFFLCFYAFMPIHAGPSEDDYHDFRIFVSVVDENGSLVSGAEVSVSAYLPSSERKNRERFREYSKPSISDEPLLFEGKCLDRVVIRANKEGYYTSWRECRFTVDYAAGRYEPWGTTITLILKRKNNQRELYVQRVAWLAVPEFNKAIGFDLEKADWVRPYGKGLESDFMFTLKRAIGKGELYQGEMDLTFSRPMDGICTVAQNHVSNSMLLLGREAPLDGYLPAFARRVGVYEIFGVLKREDEPSAAVLDGFEGSWFRVRSEVDPVTGDLKRARYGKIDGFINFEVREKEIGGQVNFVYYLTPDDSRSLEWNGKSLVPNAYLQGVKKH